MANAAGSCGRNAVWGGVLPGGGRRRNARSASGLAAIVAKREGIGRHRRAKVVVAASGSVAAGSQQVMNGIGGEAGGRW